MVSPPIFTYMWETWFDVITIAYTYIPLSEYCNSKLYPEKTVGIILFFLVVGNCLNSYAVQSHKTTNCVTK